MMFLKFRVAGGDCTNISSIYWAWLHSFGTHSAVDLKSILIYRRYIGAACTRSALTRQLIFKRFSPLNIECTCQIWNEPGVTECDICENFVSQNCVSRSGLKSVYHLGGYGLFVCWFVC